MSQPSLREMDGILGSHLTLVSAVSCSRGVLGLLSFKRQGWLTLSEPQLLLPQNRVENASPTGSLRTVSDTQEQAHGPVLVAGL